MREEEKRLRQVIAIQRGTIEQLEKDRDFWAEGDQWEEERRLREVIREMREGAALLLADRNFWAETAAYYKRELGTVLRRGPAAATTGTGPEALGNSTSD